MASPSADQGSVGVSAERFGWPLARLACSVHHSFAWNGPGVDPKNCVTIDRSWGERHALSLIAQFAAHQAFLAFAGLHDGAFDPTEWTVVKARGADVRLLRVAAASEPEWSGATPFDHVVAFADRMGVDSLSSLARPWGRADHVYTEARAKLNDGNAADQSSLIASACGALLSPGPDVLDRLIAAPAVVERDAVRVLRHLARLTSRLFVEIGAGGVNPLARGSGLAHAAPLIPELSMTDVDEAVDTLEASDAILVVEHSERLDPLSRSVVDRLTESGRQIAVVSSSGDAGFRQPTRLFVLAPTASAQQELLARMEDLEPSEQFGELAMLCESAAFDRFLECGSLPSLRASDDVIEAIQEPARSFLAALSILGTEIDLALAARFLTGIGALVTPLDLARSDVAAIEDGRFVFASEELRRQLERHLSGGMIASLAGSALEILGDDAPLLRSRLAYRSDPSAAVGVLARELDRGSIEESDARTALAGMRLRDDLLRNHSRLATIEGAVRFQRGAYRSALELVDGLDEPRARLIAARALRRLGRYGDAIDLLQSMEPSFLSLLVEGVVHRLEGELDRAEELFETAGGLAKVDEERTRLAFERAILAIDRDAKPVVAWKRKAARLCPWLVARFDMHAALAARDYDEAAGSAERAIELSPDLVDRIDAHVDRVFAFFMAGAWDRAATAAREALAIVEETEGDRAGGGLLYILAFLTADQGRWREAEATLRKLEAFYEENRDERRKRELDLIRAQIALGRLDYAAARSAAARVESSDNPEIRYAARLILDELDWMEGTLHLPRVDGSTGCAELERRTRLLVARSGQAVELEGFHAELLTFEAAAITGNRPTVPRPGTSGERLLLIRSLEAIHRRLGSRKYETELEEQCESVGIERTTDTEPPAQRFLIALAKGEMPPADLPIAGVEWRFAVRNRLGVWQQYGSLPHCESGQLEAVAGDEGVIRIGDTGLLWLQGPFEWNEELREAVANLWRVKWEHRNLMRLNEQMTGTIRDDAPVAEDGIIGESVAIREALSKIPLAARSELAVTIEGETGTGKEAFARAIHRRSSRRGRPFTPVNCGALPESLVESELFGHARGAFTGADRDRIGLIEATDGGTLFLDEIGEMPLAAQAKLLRFLQEGEFRRVGETEVRSSDVRIVAATNRTLEEEVDEGRFRQDLYYRIKGIGIDLPPLRRRGNDVLLLARHFLAEAHERAKGGPTGFTEDVETLLLGYDWPGNVRDLQNVIGGAFAFAGEARVINVEHLPQRVRNAPARPAKHGTYYEAIAQFRRQMIERSLLEAGGNQSRAAKNLGMTRQALSYQIKELGIRVKRN